MESDENIRELIDGELETEVVETSTDEGEGLKGTGGNSSTRVSAPNYKGSCQAGLSDALQGDYSFSCFDETDPKCYTCKNRN